ncbi:keratin, type I cytoskeletal 10-like [Hyalella azteca]|uniref:Mediator of RNA polymerase II transcription subunit 28 n=1 Tax=Hyalella azteca TaxID=294128 RepID=A0A8B7PH64_HYAAZ|nr:keratin, type I cytoskeletal 10-like [Hyalella azteca]
MNSSSVTVSPTPGNLLDEFEEAYQNCLAPLIREDPLTCVEESELRTNAEANTAHFIEMGRAMQAFFLQKRFQLAAQKPELVMMEDAAELRGELVRKDELIKKQSEKLVEWQATIASMLSRPGATTPSTLASSIPAPPYTSSVPSSMQAGTPGLVGTMSSVPPMAVQGAGGGMMGGGRPASGGCLMTGSHAGMGQGQHMMGSPMGAACQMGPSSMDCGRGGGVNMMGGGGGGSSPHMSMGSVNSPSSAMMQAQQGASVPTGYGGVSVVPGNTNIMGSYAGGGVMGRADGSYGGMARGSVPGGLQGPLAYLEKTTTNIGMP